MQSILNHLNVRTHSQRIGNMDFHLVFYLQECYNYTSWHQISDWQYFYGLGPNHFFWSNSFSLKNNRVTFRFHIIFEPCWCCRYWFLFYSSDYHFLYWKNTNEYDPVCLNRSWENNQTLLACIEWHNQDCPIRNNYQTQIIVWDQERDSCLQMLDNTAQFCNDGCFSTFTMIISMYTLTEKDVTIFL